MIKESDIENIINSVNHPAINCTLKELGIFTGYEIENEKKIILSFAWPFPNIPIKKMLINKIAQPILKLDAEVDVYAKERVMNEEEKKTFLIKEKENWKGGTAMCG